MISTIPRCFCHRGAIYDVWGARRAGTNLRCTSSWKRNDLHPTTAILGTGEIVMSFRKRSVCWFFLGLASESRAGYGMKSDTARFQRYETRLRQSRHSLSPLTRAQTGCAIPLTVSFATPSQLSPEGIIQAGMEHFSDHCATCHSNDGSGDTPFGRGLYPKPPDQCARVRPRTERAMASCDYAIENGIRLSGMPACSVKSITSGATPRALGTWFCSSGHLPP